MAMTRRKMAKAESIPPRAPDEPTTFLGEEPKCAPINRERINCSETCIFEAWSDGLCYSHWKEKNGYVLNAKKIYVKKKEK